MYAIRQKSTGYYLPEIKHKKGYTWTQPSKDGIPRLFKSENAAKSALKWWLEGTLGWMNVAGRWEDIELVLTPMEDRKEEDMEIVMVNILQVSSI